jgi:hypothetical protein
MNTSELGNPEDTMTAVVVRLTKAGENLDAEGVIGMCRNSEEFLAVVDGKVSNFDQFAAMEREGFKSLKKHRLTIDSLHMRTLSTDSFVALAIFHQACTDLSDVTIYLKGDVTWIFCRSSEGAWELTYLHAWHMPDIDRESM